MNTYKKVLVSAWALALAFVASAYSASTSEWIPVKATDFVPAENINFAQVNQAYLTVTFEGGVFYSGYGSWWSDFKSTDYKGSLSASATTGGNVVGLSITKVVSGGPNVSVEWGVSSAILKKLPVNDVSQVILNVTATKTSKNGVDMTAQQIKTQVDKIPIATPYSDTAFAVYGMAKSLLDGLFPGDDDGDRISSSQGVSLSEVPNGIYVVFGSPTESDYSKYKQNQSALSWRNGVLSFTENGIQKPIQKVAYYVIKAEWSSTRFKGSLEDELSAVESWGKSYRDAENAARRVSLGVTGAPSNELVNKAGEAELLKIQSLNNSAYALLSADKGVTTKEAVAINRQLSAYTESLCIERLKKNGRAILGVNFAPTWENSFADAITPHTSFLKTLDAPAINVISQRVQAQIRF